MRRRILHVLEPPDGGVLQHVIQLAGALTERGWEVDVAGPAAAGPGSSQRARLEAAGASVHALPMTSLAGAGDVRAARALRRLDRDRRFAVIHAHSSKAGAITRAALPDHRRIAYTPHCFAFRAGFGRARPLFWAAEQALVPRTGALVASSRWEASAAKRFLAGAASRVRVVPYGVPPCGGGEPHPALVALRERGPVIGFLARLAPQKDPLLLVEAAARRPLPGTVAIVGSGPLEGAVREAIAARRLGERVVQLPFEPPVERFLRGFDLLVMPSRWESLPIAILEAMACGLPVVATDVGGVAEAVRDGETGRVVPAGDAEALAAAVLELASDARARAAMGERAARDAAERFSLRRMVDDLEGVYAERAAA